MFPYHEHTVTFVEIPLADITYCVEGIFVTMMGLQSYFLQVIMPSFAQHGVH